MDREKYAAWCAAIRECVGRDAAEWQPPEGWRVEVYPLWRYWRVCVHGYIMATGHVGNGTRVAEMRARALLVARALFQAGVR